MLVAALLLAPLSAGQRAAFAAPEGAARARPAALVPVTVVIHRVDAGCTPEASGQDFFAVVDIGPTRFSFADEPGDDDNSLRWRWTAVGEVDDAAGSVPIIIRLHEWDLPDLNDIVDINPDDARHRLDITFDLASGHWTVDQGPDGPAGDLPFGQWRIWSGAEDPDCAEIEFDIVAGASEDADGDGLLDNWERYGLDADGDGAIDVDLPAMGARVDHKDLFVEVDWMQAADHSHEPLQATWDPLWRAFDQAPVANPDGVQGIKLHVDTGTLYSAAGTSDCDGDGVPAPGDTHCDGDGIIDIGDLGALGAGTPGGGNLVTERQFLDFTNTGDVDDFYATKSANFDSRRALVFHYAVFAHSLSAARPTTTGRGEVWGNDLLVTLGGTADVTDQTLSPITGLIVSGTVRMQAGTFMHELGHNLSLQHATSYLANGVSQVSNNQPNYLSVMNYDHQYGLSGLRNNNRRGLDYSVAALPAVDESSLDDCALFGEPRVNAMPRWTVGPITTVISAAVTGPAFTVNWNNDFDGTGAPILQGASCGNGTANYALDLNVRAGDAVDLIVFNGVDDWNQQMDFRFQMSSKFADGAPFDPHQDITLEAYHEQEATRPRFVELEAPGQMCSTATEIDFEDLAVGTLVSGQYLGQGAVVVANPSVEAKIRDDADRGAATWSPTQSLYASPYLVPSSLGIPLVISFTYPVYRVGMAIGNGGTLGAPGTLRAYSPAGQLIGQVIDPIPEAVTEFLGIYALEETIGRVELDYPIDAGEEIDYLTFDDCADPGGPITPPTTPVDVTVEAEARDVVAAGAGGQQVVTHLAAVPVEVNGQVELTDFSGAVARGEPVSLLAPRWAIGPGGEVYAFAYWQQGVAGGGGLRLDAGDLSVARTLNADGRFTAVYHRATQIYLPGVSRPGSGPPATATQTSPPGATATSTATATPTATATATRTATPTATGTATGATTRVSVIGSGAQANGNSAYASLSASAAQVAFHSYATNLVSGDSNGQLDVFVRDLATITTTRVSRATGGAQAVGGASFNPRLSGDGRYVAFESLASNLVLTDTNSARDIFVHDRQMGTTTRVSVGPGGAQANGLSGFGLGGNGLAISGDGSLVAFQSEASNLVITDTNSARDIFVHDLGSGTTTRVSVGPGGAQANGVSLWPALSDDGRYVAFYSSASNLVTGDTNGAVDIFVHDRQTGATTRVSVGIGGAQPNGNSRSPAISADGRYVAYTSGATNLAANDTNAADDIFVYDRQTGATTRISNAPGAVPSNGYSDLAALSADGRYVVFKSTASNLVAGDNNGAWDIFVHDRQTGATTRVSVGPGGAQANSDSNTPALSADGRYAAFESSANNLVVGDTNNASDVFVHDRGP
jgi:Tol biopolymer transport system component